MFSSSQPEYKYGPEAEESGYLTYVSPQKKKINDDSIVYFNIDLEQHGTVRRGVCFEPEMRKEFKSKEGQPIKICCKRQLFDNSLVISKKPCIQEVALSYPLVRSKEHKFESIFEIKMDRTERQVNSILTLMECKKDVKSIATRFGPRNLKVYIADDTTASIDLEVWGDTFNDILEIGKTYSARTLRTYIFSDQQKLSTMIDTEIEPILYSNVAENSQNVNCNKIENMAGVDHSKEEQPDRGKTLNFRSFPLNKALFKTEPNLDAEAELPQNSDTSHLETTTNAVQIKVEPNTIEMASKIKLENREGKEMENLDTHTSKNHFNYTGNIYSIIIDKYYLCGKCHGRNEIPSNAEHFKCKKCKIMFKIANYKKKLLSYCTLHRNKRTFKFNNKIITKLEEKFPASHDLETSLIEYKNNVTLKCIEYNNDNLVTDIIFHDY